MPILIQGSSTNRTRRTAENGETATAAIAVKEPKRYPFLVDIFIRLVRTKPLGTVGLFLVLVFFLVGILADVLAPFGYNDINLAVRLLPPSPGHILGTDNLGGIC